MRNLIQYPITNDEAISILERIKSNILAEQYIGDLRAYVIQLVIENIKKHPIDGELP